MQFGQGSEGRLSVLHAASAAPGRLRAVGYTYRMAYSRDWPFGPGC